VAAQLKMSCAGASGDDFIAQDFNAISAGLLPRAAQEFIARNSPRESQIILHVGFPAGHGFAGVDDERVAFGTAKIDRRGKAGDAAAHDDNLGLAGGFHVKR